MERIISWGMGLRGGAKKDGINCKQTEQLILDLTKGGGIKMIKRIKNFRGASVQNFKLTMLRKLKFTICLFFLISLFGFSKASNAFLFQEKFEDTSFSSRGWYDSTGGTLSSTEHISGSTKSFQCRFLLGGTNCTSGTPHRHIFTESDSVYVSYWIKYSTNWVGSGKPYHPHQFYLLTNQNGQYDGLSYDHLTAYIEENGGTPQLVIQDGQNIDETKIGQNLVSITENRAVAGCNGDSDGYGNGDCYQAGSVHFNGKTWKTGQVYFSNSTGPYYKSDWHHVEAYFKLNSILSGKGKADGVMKYWFDGKLIIDHSNVMFRTGQYPNMKFNQFVMDPWIGDGSPVDQTFWIDDLTVATAPPSQDLVAPSPPTNVMVN